MSRSEGSSHYLRVGLSAWKIMKCYQSRCCKAVSPIHRVLHNVIVPVPSFAVKCSHYNNQGENDASDDRTSYDACWICERKRQVLEEIGGSEYFLKGLLCTFSWQWKNLQKLTVDKGFLFGEKRVMPHSLIFWLMLFSWLQHFNGCREADERPKGDVYECNRAGGGVSFTSIVMGDHALGRFSTPLAVLLAHAVLGPLEWVSLFAGERQFSSLHIWDSQFLPVFWRWKVPTRRHCTARDTAQHSEPARSQRSGDASASLTWYQSLQERNVTLERSSRSISHRWATTHQDVIPTQQRNPLASTHWIDKSPQSQ